MLGAGNWTWRNIVFRSLSGKLNICGSESNLNGSSFTTLEKNCSECRQAENTTGIASPANLLNKTLNKFKSLRSASTPLSSSPKQKTFTGVKKTRTATTDAVKYTSSTKSDQADRSVLGTESEDEITCIKHLYTSNHDASETSTNQIFSSNKFFDFSQS